MPISSKHLITVGVAALAWFLFSYNVQAAAPSRYNVVDDTYTTVEPAQMSAFEAGIKSWHQCLGQHHFKYTIHAYQSASGNRFLYQFVTNPMSWSEQHAMKFPSACKSLFMSEVLPHEVAEDTIFLVLMPGLSHPVFSDLPKNKPFGRHLMRAISYTLKNGLAADHAFTKAMKEVYAAPMIAHVSPWHYSATFEVLGGGAENSPNYLLVGAFKNWAFFGAGPDQPIAKLLGEAYGKAKASAIFQSLANSIQHVSAQFYHYDPTLSYTPP